MNVTVIYKILKRSEWLAAQASGQFVGSEVDNRDGYIHFSTAEQAQETAHKHFKGQSDLVVLAVDDGKIDSHLKWEPSRGGALFPHLYEPLKIGYVTAVFEAPLDSQGVPMLAFLEPEKGE